jgi:rhodanese-related sulfurtransferase
MATLITRTELAAKLAEGLVALIDAQGPRLFETELIPGAIRASTDDPAAVVAAIGPDLEREIITYCTDVACTGSAIAVAGLEAQGYRNVRRYAEGNADWVAGGLPTQSA